MLLKWISYLMVCCRLIRVSVEKLSKASLWVGGSQGKPAPDQAWKTGQWSGVIRVLKKLSWN